MCSAAVLLCQSDTVTEDSSCRWEYSEFVPCCLVQGHPATSAKGLSQGWLLFGAAEQAHLALQFPLEPTFHQDPPA